MVVLTAMWWCGVRCAMVMWCGMHCGLVEAVVWCECCALAVWCVLCMVDVLMCMHRLYGIGCVYGAWGMCMGDGAGVTPPHPPRARAWPPSSRARRN